MPAEQLFRPEGHWSKVRRCDPSARALADRHYSRQTPGAVDFMGNGRVLVLLTHDALAVWGVIENLDPAGGHRWRCSIFRNEGSARSSDLIREAIERNGRDREIERRLLNLAESIEAFSRFSSNYERETKASLSMKYDACRLEIRKALTEWREGVKA